MKIHKSQTGFSPLHILLLMVLFGIIGFAGWKVYDAGKSTKPADSSIVAPPTNTPQSQSDKSSIPEGFVEYKNEELGFKFIHPKGWQINEKRVTAYPSSESRDLPHIELTSDDFQEDEEAFAYGGTKTGAIYSIRAYFTSDKVLDVATYGPDNFRFNPQIVDIDGRSGVDYFRAYEGPAHQTVEFINKGFHIHFQYRYKDGGDRYEQGKATPYDQRYLDIRKQMIDSIKFL